MFLKKRPKKQKNNDRFDEDRSNKKSNKKRHLHIKRENFMAEVHLRLVYNKNTSKHDIYIDYESDTDALPFEHEQEHKEIVQKIIENAGLDKMTEDDFGEIVVRRLSQQEKKEVLQEEMLREAQRNKNQ